MKQIIETKMVEQTTVRFVAKDGREFQGENAEKRCEDYERRLNTAGIEKEFEKLNKAYITLPLIDWVSCDCGVYVTTLNSEDDFNVLVDYYCVHNSDFDAEWYKPKTFPATVIVTEEDSGYISIYKGSVAKIIEEMNAARNILASYV